VLVALVIMALADKKSHTPIPQIQMLEKPLGSGKKKLKTVPELP
jgi:hypothetical protein